MSTCERHQEESASIHGDDDRVTLAELEGKASRNASRKAINTF